MLLVAREKGGGEGEEYYLASAFEEIYAPPMASLSLRGFSVSGECGLFTVWFLWWC